MKITSTKSKIHKIKMAIYGPPGVGKTVLGATAPRPIIIDAERGTLSIADQDLDLIEISTFDDLEEAYDFLCTKKAKKKYDTCVIDSGSEVAEYVLADLKKSMKDGRQAYMALGERALEIFRMFRDLDMHVVFICKAKISTSDGVEMNRASFPGQALVEKVPYLFDELLALRIMQDDDEDGGYRYLQTQPSFNWDAKDRSGTLDDMEEPDLTKIFKKILKGKKVKR